MHSNQKHPIVLKLYYMYSTIYHVNHYIYNIYTSTQQTHTFLPPNKEEKNMIPFRTTLSKVGNRPIKC